MRDVCPLLKNKLIDLDIDLVFVDMERSGFYYPKERIIVVNAKLLESNNIDFAVAHELAHFLQSHKSISVLYKNSPVHRSKIEYEANILAIKMLVNSYLLATGLEYQQLNAAQFMAYYKIDSKLYDDIYKTLSAVVCGA